MEGEKERIEQTMFRLLDYRSEHEMDQESLLIMLSLLNLMGLVNALNRDGSGAASSGGSNMQALLGPLLALMAAGMGGGSGQQGQFNPTALLSLLGGSGGGNQPDLTGLLGLLGSLMGMGTQGQAAGTTPGTGKKKENRPTPVQREINLDRNDKSAGGRNTVPDKEVVNRNKDGAGCEKDTAGERCPPAGEVLEWNFGT